MYQRDRAAASHEEDGRMHAWHLRRNVLQRDLRAAARDLSAIAEQRVSAVRKRRAGTKFRPLSRHGGWNRAPVRAFCAILQ
jgi:hypothetical protein